MRYRFIALLAALVFAVSAAGASSYPTQNGPVNDGALVLSSQTAEDIVTLNERLADATDYRMIVVTCHFLGGAEKGAYADGLFDAWDLTKNDLLLVLIIGEESYSVRAGSEVDTVLSQQMLDGLSYSQLRESYLAQDYDKAVGQFLTEVASRLIKNANADVSLSGLFVQAEENPQTENEAGSQSNTGGVGSLWGDISSSGENRTADFENFEYDQQNSNSGNDFVTQGNGYTAAEDDSWIREENDRMGISFWRIILFAMLLLFIFARRSRRGKSGCGPLGWLLGGIGLGSLFRTGSGHPRGRTPFGGRK